MIVLMFKRKSVGALFFRALSLLAIALALSAPTAFFAQTPAGRQAEQKQGMSGVSTGAALNYTSRRTVGVTDPKAPVVFEDITARTALANFKHRSGGPNKDYILEAPSGGIAIFDYDGDGLPDIYILNGS